MPRKSWATRNEEFKKAYQGQVSSLIWEIAHKYDAAGMKTSACMTDYPCAIIFKDGPSNAGNKTIISAHLFAGDKGERLHFCILCDSTSEWSAFRNT